MWVKLSCISKSRPEKQEASERWMTAGTHNAGGCKSGHIQLLVFVRPTAAGNLCHSSDDRLLLRECELGAKGDRSPGSALIDQGMVLQHLSTVSRGGCW